jgi:hypothetical protein
MSPDLDTARSVVGEQTALLEHACTVHAQTTASRLEAESALAALQAEREMALSASSADRASDTKAHAVAILDVRIEHAVRDARATVEADELAAERELVCQKNVAEAEAALAQAEGRAMRRDGDFEELARAAAKELVESVQRFRYALKIHREALMLDAESAKAVGEAPRDGVAATGFLMGELLAAGGKLQSQNSHNELRWCLDNSGPDVAHGDLDTCSTDLFPMLVQALSVGERMPHVSQVNVEQVIAAWKSSMNIAEASDKLRRFHEAEGHARVARETQHRNERIAALKEQELQPGDVEFETQSGAKGIRRAVRNLVAALSPQQVAERRFAKDRRPGVDGRPAANTPLGEYNPRLDPSAPEFGQTAESAAEVAPQTPLPYGTTRLTQSPRVTWSGPTSVPAPHHETPSATIVGSSGITTRLTPTATRSGYVRSPIDGRERPTREALGDRDGEFVISEALPSTEGLMGPHGLERVAANRVIRPRR